MSSTTATASAVSRDPFDFTNAPAKDWLPAIKSEHSYHESLDYEISDPLLQAELADESQSALCALMATSVAGEGTTEAVSPLQINTGTSKDTFIFEKGNKLEIAACCKELQELSVVSVTLGF